MDADPLCIHVNAVPSSPPSPRPLPPRHHPQHQNSNLREELSALLGDVEPGLPWAEEVFGGPPEVRGRRGRAGGGQAEGGEGRAGDASRQTEGRGG